MCVCVCLLPFVWLCVCVCWCLCAIYLEHLLLQIYIHSVYYTYIYMWSFARACHNNLILWLQQSHSLAFYHVKSYGFTILWDLSMFLFHIWYTSVMGFYFLCFAFILCVCVRTFWLSQNYIGTCARTYNHFNCFASKRNCTIWVYGW